MSAADLLGLIVSAAARGLPPLRAAARGAVLAMLQGWIQIIVFCRRAVRDRAAARRLHGARLHATSACSSPGQTAGAAPTACASTSIAGWKSRAAARSGCSGSYCLILRTQTLHPFNPDGFHSGTWDLSFNTASSFVTNTNWQYYGGETTLTYFSQMAGLAVQNFVSAAVGIVVAIALIRGDRRARRRAGLGNFWQDLTRALLYVLLPISFVGALVLASQGVVQSLARSGPVASQEIIKVLGTNGGGFFNVNSAMPFENPNGLTNFLEMLAMLAIPASLTYTYGRMVGSRRQGWTIFGAMFVLFAVSVIGRLPRRVRTSRPPSTPPASSARTWRARRCASAPPARRCGPRSPPPPRPARSTPRSSR